MNRLYGWVVCSLICICTSASLEAQTLTKYMQQKQKEVAEKQRIEKKRYESACEKGTLEAFQEYMKLYPNGKYAPDVKKRIEDYDLWAKAVDTNTVAAYNNYLSTSKFKSFKDKANEAIVELQSIEKWKSIKSSKSISEIELFIRTYPKSSCVDKAQKRIHELKGANYYSSNDLINAYHEFNKAGGKYALDQANQSKFDECQENWDYNNLTAYSKEEQLLSFLRKYPSGKYSDEISNRVAISKAKSFNMYSGDTSFNEALRYAKDETTKDLVRRYADNSKKAYSQHKKQLRRARIKANGGYVLFGLELLDFGWNGISPDRYFNVGYYNVGASIKLGNYRSPVQFELGVKPGVIFYNYADENDSYYDSDYETHTEFHLPAYAKLKINICNIGKSSKFYIAGLGFYNIVRNEELENQFSVGGGTGFAWKRWDWLTLYYKQDLNNIYSLDDKYLGTSLIYYF